jgi:ribonuclease HI
LREPWSKRGPILFETSGRKSEQPEENAKMTSTKLENNPSFDWGIYTDGSAKGSNKNGGAAVVITTGSVAEPIVAHRLLYPAGRWCSSFQTEMVAINIALAWLIENGDTWTSARIVSDSKSSIECIRGNRFRTNNNEEADTVAKEASTLEQLEEGWLYDVAKARIRGVEETIHYTHQRSYETYGRTGVIDELEAGLSRQDAVRLSRFRAGHSTELRSYMKRIGQMDDDTCRACGLEPETTPHIVKDCLRLRATRHHLGINAMCDLCTRLNELVQF